MKIVFANPYGMKASYDHKSKTAFIDGEWYMTLSEIGKHFILQWLDGMSIIDKNLNFGKRERFCDIYAFNQSLLNYHRDEIMKVFVTELLPTIR